MGWKVENVTLNVESVNGSGSNATAKIALVIDSNSGDNPIFLEERVIIELEASLQKSNGEWKIVQERIFKDEGGLI